MRACVVQNCSSCRKEITWVHACIFWSLSRAPLTSTHPINELARVAGSDISARTERVGEQKNTSRKFFRKFVTVRKVTKIPACVGMLCCGPCWLLQAKVIFPIITLVVLTASPNDGEISTKCQLHATIQSQILSHKHKPSPNNLFDRETACAHELFLFPLSS